MNTATKTNEAKIVIFMDDFIDVPLSLALVRRCFVHSESWLADLADAAEADGAALRIQIGPPWVDRFEGRKVDVTLGPTRQRGEAVVMQIDWKASGLTSALPVLNGDLELAPLGPNLCRLTLAASYLPPCGEFGQALDHALMHRVAQSTVRSFLERLATHFETGNGEAPTRTK